MKILEQLSDSLQRGDTDGVAQLTAKALADGLSPQSILDDGLIAGMSVVGEKFRVHDIFLPDVLLAARAMYAGMDKLKPLLLKEGIPTIGKVVLGSVQGDLHDIGKNLVGIMLRGAGFEVIDLGNDVSPEKFVDSAVSEGARIIGMSALLTTTMPVMKKVVDLVKQRGLSNDLKIIVGGAPVSADYAKSIEADAYCFDGISAVDCVKKYLGVS